MEKRYFDRLGLELPRLGFGCMRLPVREDGQVDRKTGQAMVERAMEAGVNYFDTAYRYHEGQSEPFVGEALRNYPRESYTLATKMPTWNLVRSPEDAERIFAEQLRLCRTEYFDLYLVHCLNEANYRNARRHGIYDILRRKKEQGFIRCLGFSFHDHPGLLEEILKNHEWDFVQLQINYLDWESIQAGRQYELACRRGLPVIVMEPLRGGALATLNPEAAGILREADPKAGPASWALRYAASLPGVASVLSGMSTPEQLEDNIRIMSEFAPLSKEEQAVVARAAAAYRSSGAVPCTGCRYCMDCPSGVDIPRIFDIYNHYKATKNPIAFDNNYRSLRRDQQAAACVSCEICIERCPQQIPIPERMAEVAAFAESVGF